MKIEIKPGAATPDSMEKTLGLKAGSIKSITRHGGSEPGYPAGAVTVEVEDTLTAGQVDQIKALVGENAKAV